MTESYYIVPVSRKSDHGNEGRFEIGKKYPVNIEDMTVVGEDGLRFSLGMSFEVFKGSYAGSNVRAVEIACYAFDIVTD